MTTVRRSRKGFGILLAVVVLSVLVVLVTLITACLARLTVRSSRYGQGVRSRALAEAGIEAALAKINSGRAADVKPLRFELDGGACSVEVLADDKAPGRVTISSTGRLKLAGGEMTSRVTLALESPDAAAGRPMRVLSRQENTRYVRTERVEKR